MGQITSMKTETPETAKKQIKDSLAAVASDVVSEAKYVGTEVLEKAKEATGDVLDTVRRYPLQSVLIGVGVGFLAALALNRGR